MQRHTTATTENNQVSIEQEDTSRPGDLAHEDVTVESDPRDQRLELARLNPPKKPGQKFAFGVGRMKSWEGKAFQISSETRAVIAHFRGLAETVRREIEAMPPGAKFDAPCIYTGVPRIDGSCKASNFWFAALGALDLDGTIRNEEEYDLLCRILTPYECILLPTASHDPANGIWRLRVFMVLSVSVDDWGLYAAVGEWLLAQVAMGLGIRSKAEAISRGMDLCTKKPFQPLLIPRFPSIERKRVALKYWRVFNGNPVTPDMSKILRKLEESTKSHGVRASTICIEDDGTIDRLASALSDLSRSDLASLRPGEGRSDAGLWRAACTFRDWGVPQDDALSQMISRYVPLGHEESRVAHKVSSAYERTDDPRYGWRLRAAVAGRPMTLPQMVHSRQDVTDESLNRREDSSVTSQTPARGPEYCDRWQRDIGALHTRVLYRRSPQGTGKTETLVRLLHQFRTAISAGAKRVVLLVHRVSLAKNLSRRLGLPYYRDPALSGQIEGSCVVCLDSVGRVALEVDGGDGFFAALGVDILIVDESEQVIRHLFGETVSKRFAAVWSHLKALFRASAHIILQDADLGRVTVDATRILLGWETPEACDEFGETNTWRCGSKMRLWSDEATLQGELLEAVQAGGKHAIYCTSKTAATALVEALRQETGRRILGITAETSGAGDAFEVLEDPKDAHKKWDVIVYTGSANTGISIDEKGIWEVWGFIRGGAGPTEKDALQGLCRVRHPVGPVRVWVGGRDNSIWWGTNPERNLADLLTRNDKTKKIVSRVTSWDEKYIRDAGDTYFEVHNKDALRLLAIVMAEEALSVDMAAAFRAHVEASGWDIEEEGQAPDEERAEAKQVVTAGKDTAEEKRRELIKRAEIMSIENAKAKVDAGGSPEDHAALDAAIIRDFYGLRRTDPITDEILDRDDRGRYRSKVRLFVQTLLTQRGHVQAVLAPTVRSAKADPTGVTWDHRGTMADTLARVWAIFGIRDLELDAEAGTIIQIPTDLPMGPETRERFRRDLGLRAPSIQSLQKGKVDVTDESLKEREDSSVTLSRRQWGYLLRAIAGKTAALSWEQEGAGPDRGKRIGRLDPDVVRQLLQDGKRYMDRLLAGAEWRDPLIDDIAQCPVTVDDLLDDSEFIDLATVARTEGHLEEEAPELAHEVEVQAEEEEVGVFVEVEKPNVWAQGMIEALLE